MSTPGQDVVAVTGGRVVNTGRFTAKDLSLEYITIETSDGYVVRQGYLNQLTVSKTDVVTAGQVVGRAGSLQVAYPPRPTGTMTDHIHVDISHNGARIDPISVIPVP